MATVDAVEDSRDGSGRAERLPSWLRWWSAGTPLDWGYAALSCIFVAAGYYDSWVNRNLPVKIWEDAPAQAALMAALKPRSAGCASGRWLMSEVRRHDTAALLDAIGELGSFDSGSWLGAGEQPSAVVVMAQDTVVSAEAQHDLARVLRRCRVYEMDGDHFACVKRPTQFNSVLTDACAHLVAPA